MRDIRYQAAVVRDADILVVQVSLADGRRFWLLPGGGREPEDRSAAACVRREVHEETGLEVVVDRLLIAAPAPPDDETYLQMHTYLCRPSSGEPAAGSPDGMATVTAVRWLAIDDESSWGDEIRNDRFLYPQLARIREVMRHGRVEGAPAE
jgi:8-oxo-dGTP pyrophosphatase MutT (NUDIX family)